MTESQQPNTPTPPRSGTHPPHVFQAHPGELVSPAVVQVGQRQEHAIWHLRGDLVCNPPLQDRIPLAWQHSNMTMSDIFTNTGELSGALLLALDLFQDVLWDEPELQLPRLAELARQQLPDYDGDLCDKSTPGCTSAATTAVLTGLLVDDDCSHEIWPDRNQQVALLCRHTGLCAHEIDKLLNYLQDFLSSIHYALQYDDVELPSPSSSLERHVLREALAFIDCVLDQAGSWLTGAPAWAGIDHLQQLLGAYDDLAP